MVTKRQKDLKFNYIDTVLDTPDVPLLDWLSGSLIGELGVKRASCLQCDSRVKKPRPEGHVKYLCPLNVPSEHAVCSSSCNIKKNI